MVLLLPIPVCPEWPNGQYPVITALGIAHVVGGIVDAHLLRAEGLPIHIVLGAPEHWHPSSSRGRAWTLSRHGHLYNMEGYSGACGVGAGMSSWRC